MRHLLVLECSPTTVLSSLLESFVEKFPKGLIMSDLIIDDKVQPLRYSRELLGSTIEALIMDCRDGFALDYFLCAANTVQKGTCLILILDASGRINTQSSRFHIGTINTPFFNHYLWEGLRKYASFIEADNTLSSLNSVDYECLEDFDYQEQFEIIDDFNREKEGIYTLFAPRGTGKSWLGSELIRLHPEEYCLTAPNQSALFIYHERLKKVPFKAPDALFLEGPNNDVKNKILLIEEAAKIPLAHLERLSKQFSKIMMISSTDNYEGTRQGLREKIADLMPIRKGYRLNHRKRFYHDNLAKFCHYLQFHIEENLATEREINLLKEKDHEMVFQMYEGDTLEDFRRDITRVQNFYRLLNETHYQSNVQDIRRIMDADQQVFITVMKGSHLVGALWGIKEGGLSKKLSLEVFKGLRRPKGNLGAQTLSAHSYYPEAMQFLSLRVSRISVREDYRRQGIGQKMLQYLQQAFQLSRDYLSVSYGLTAPLLKFWEASGFDWIHLGSHRDKVTGLHAALMIIPISSKAKIWHQIAIKKFKHDAYYWQTAQFIRQETQDSLKKYAEYGLMDERDQMVIHAYETYAKTKMSVYPALMRREQ